MKNEIEKLNEDIESLEARVFILRNDKNDLLKRIDVMHENMVKVYYENTVLKKRLQKYEDV